MNYTAELIQDELVVKGTNIPTWTNIIPCEKSFSLINTYGQGLSVDRESGILHYAGPRRYFYVYDTTTKEAFSPTFVPLMKGVTNYEVRMHPAYSKFIATSEMGIQSEVVATVDPLTGLETWMVQLSNNTPNTKTIHVTGIFFPGHMKNIGYRCFYDKSSNTLIREVIPYIYPVDPKKDDPNKQLAFLWSDKTPSSYNCSVAKLFPLEEMVTNPNFLYTGDLGNDQAFQEIACQAMDFQITLKPNQNESILFAIGAVHKSSEISERTKHLTKENCFKRAKDHWKIWDKPVKVSLPHQEMTQFVNTFAKHQVRMNCVTARWSCAPATRNWCIDWQAAGFILPNDALQALRDTLKAQHSSGYLPQGFTTGEGGKLVDMHNMDFRDAISWVPFFTLTLLVNLGDSSFLYEKLPYADKGEATILEHLIQGLRFLREHRGKNGLILIGEGDWNDLMNNVGKEGKGESMMITPMYLFSCKNVIEICSMIGEEKFRKDIELWYQETANDLNKNAWDGEWYIRAFTDDGSVVGSSQCKEGKIFINPQAWSLAAGAVPQDRIDTVLNAVEKHLATPYGVLLLTPAYKTPDRKIGRLTIELPGLKENASSYISASLFYAFGLFCIGKKEKAFELITQILPGNPLNHFTKSGQNPGYIPNCYYGPEAGEAFAGKGSNANWTGTAPYFFWLCLREILGIKGTLQGVKILPSFPNAWNEASCEIEMRGTLLKISYSRGEDKGLFYKNKKLTDNHFTDFMRGETRELKVVI